MIEQLIDWSLWALTAAPFLIGKLGGGGGGSAQPPQLSPEQSAQLYERQLQLMNQYMPTLAGTAGRTERGQAAENTLFGLEMLTNPTGRMFVDRVAEHTRLRDISQAELTRLQGQGATPQRDARIAELQTNITNQNNAITHYGQRDVVAELRGALPQQFAARDQLLGRLGEAQASTPEYRRMQQALSSGTLAQQVGAREADTATGTAAEMGAVRDVQAGQVGAGALGNTLMGRAEQMAQSTGRLSADGERDAVQSARQGMSARGMATGSAGLAAEMLNRDRYSRQRQFQDLGFAQGVQTQDIERQLQNVGNVMRADLANQQTQFGRNQFNAANQQQANLANMQAANQMSQFNTTLGAETDRFNAAQRTDTERYNIGLLGSAAQASDQERARQLAIGQDSYNFGLSTDPRMMLAGLGSPYASMTAPAMSMLSGVQGLQPMYTGGQFSRGGLGGGLMGGAMGALGGAASGAALGTAIGPGYGTALGAGLGLLGGLTGFMGGSR